MLPWVEKYRPTNLDNIILDDDNKTMFKNMIDEKFFPQLLFYGPPGTGKSTTIICRCLSLSKEEISGEISEELLTAGALKRVTRAGMGICQGRYCSSFTIAKAAEKTQSTPSEYSGFAPQPPFKPTPIGIIAQSTAS